ncbi:MAG: HAD hydrolase family protein [Candidatus Zixiibacteriota bacterium]
MINISIPGLEPISIKYLASDFSGTLSVDGIVSPGIIDRLNQLAQLVEIHILTADTHGKVDEALAGVDCRLVKLDSTAGLQDIQKEKYIEQLGSNAVMAIGNGRNDRLMLKRAIIGVAVCLDEGCSVEALKSADIIIKSAESALDLLLFPNRLKATLRI